MLLKFLLKYFIPINLLIDIFTNTIWQQSYSIASIRGIILIIVIVIAWIKNPRNTIYTPFIIYTFYIILILITASDFGESIRLSSKVLTSLWLFPVIYVYNYLYTEKVIIYNVLLISLILISNYILSTFFGIGISEYTLGKEFLVGNLSDAWPIYTYTLFLFIIILKSNQLSTTTKIIYLIFFALLALQLIVSLKRISIIVFFMGMILFLYFEKTNIRTIGLALIGSIFIFFLINKYSDVINLRFEARQDRILGNYRDMLETERRYLETLIVWEEILSFKVVSKSLFGLEAFKSIGEYGTGEFGDRVIHVDYNLILHTTGIFGFFLYYYILFSIFRIFIRKKNILDQTYKELFIIIFFSQFVMSFSGQMLSITYSSIKFIFMAISLNKYKS